MQYARETISYCSHASLILLEVCVHFSHLYNLILTCLILLYDDALSMTPMANEEYEECTKNPEKTLPLPASQGIAHQGMSFVYCNPNSEDSGQVPAPPC